MIRRSSGWDFRIGCIDENFVTGQTTVNPNGDSTLHVLLLLHAVLFAYWLGADLGVFYAARFAADGKYSVETRQTIGAIMAFVDLAPRLSVPLVGATGISMGVISGAISMRVAWVWAVWLAALLWVASNVHIHRNRAALDRIQPVIRFDTRWRFFLMVVAAGAAIASLLGLASRRTSHSR